MSRKIDKFHPSKTLVLRTILLSILAQPPILHCSTSPVTISSIQLYILSRWANRLIRGRKIALVESANLVGLEGTNNGMKDTAVVEKNEVVLAPGDQKSVTRM